MGNPRDNVCLGGDTFIYLVWEPAVLREPVLGQQLSGELKTQRRAIHVVSELAVRWTNKKTDPTVEKSVMRDKAACPGEPGREETHSVEVHCRQGGGGAGIMWRPD